MYHLTLQIPLLDMIYSQTQKCAKKSRCTISQLIIPRNLRLHVYHIKLRAQELAVKAVLNRCYSIIPCFVFYAARTALVATVLQSEKAYEKDREREIGRNGEREIGRKSETEKRSFKEGENTFHDIFITLPYGA